MVFFSTHLFRKYGDFSYHPGWGNRNKNEISIFRKNRIWQMPFQAISPFAENLFTHPSGCPTYRWGLQTAAGTSYPGQYHCPGLGDVFAISADVKKTETHPGQRVACDSLLINKHLCFLFAVCNLMLRFQRKVELTSKKKTLQGK